MAPLGRLRAGLRRFPRRWQAPSDATLDGKTAHSNNFLRCLRRRTGYDTTRDAG
jgi:hypothetical protein